MTAMRIAHISDTHLGYRQLAIVNAATGRNQRELDVEAAFHNAMNAMLAWEPDVILHAGDVFHSPRPSWGAIRSCIATLKRAQDAGVPTIVIAGNHDTPRLRASADVFDVMAEALPGITFVTGREQRSIELLHLDLCVHAIPHGALVGYDPPSIPASTAKATVVLTHGLVGGLSRFTPELGEEQVPDRLLPSEVDYIALGDWHKTERVKENAWYAGSTERIGWGDYAMATPGWLAVALLPAMDDRPLGDELPDPTAFFGWDVSVEHQPVATRRMVQVGPINAEGLSAQEIAVKACGAVDVYWPDRDTMVRIVIERAERTAKREAESIIRRRLGRSAFSVQIATTLRDRDPVDILSREVELPTVTEMFGEYIESRRGVWSEEFREKFTIHAGAALETAVAAQAERNGAQE